MKCTERSFIANHNFTLQSVMGGGGGGEGEGGSFQISVPKNVAQCWEMHHISSFGFTRGLVAFTVRKWSSKCWYCLLKKSKANVFAHSLYNWWTLQIRINWEKNKSSDSY